MPDGARFLKSDCMCASLFVISGVVHSMLGSLREQELLAPLSLKACIYALPSLSYIHWSDAGWEARYIMSHNNTFTTLQRLERLGGASRFLIISAVQVYIFFYYFLCTPSYRTRLFRINRKFLLFPTIGLNSCVKMKNRAFLKLIFMKWVFFAKIAQREAFSRHFICLLPLR